MEQYELYLPPAHTGRNPVTGRFMKGNTPSNKGKRWSDYMGKRAQKRAARGWKNLDTYRPTTRPDTAGRRRRQVIAVTDDGRFHHFSYIGAAAEWCGGRRENVGRCCRENASRKTIRKPWGKPTQRINTDHRYLGIRFYFEDDDIWTTKIHR